MRMRRPSAANSSRAAQIEQIETRLLRKMFHEPHALGPLALGSLDALHPPRRLRLVGPRRPHLTGCLPRRDLRAGVPRRRLGHPGGRSWTVVPRGVIDEDGQAWPLYSWEGQTTCSAKPGSRYRIHVTNRSAARVEAVVSVDGLEVIGGRPADLQQRAGTRARLRRRHHRRLSHLDGRRGGLPLLVGARFVCGSQRQRPQCRCDRHRVLPRAREHGRASAAPRSDVQSPEKRRAYPATRPAPPIARPPPRPCRLRLRRARRAAVGSGRTARSRKLRPAVRGAGQTTSPRRRQNGPGSARVRRAPRIVGRYTTFERQLVVARGRRDSLQRSRRAARDGRSHRSAVCVLGRRFAPLREPVSGRSLQSPPPGDPR